MHYNFQFCVIPFLPELKKKMDELQVSYKMTTGIAYDMVDFTLPDNFPFLQEIISCLPKTNMKSPFKYGKIGEVWHFGERIPELEVFEYYSVGYCKVGIFPYPCYSKEDMESANWFYVYSENIKLDITNWKEGNLQNRTCRIGDDRRYHVSLENLVAIKKVPKWTNKKCFATSCQLLLTTLFCNDRAKDLIKSSDLKGVEFRPVLKKDEKTDLLDINQIYPIEKISSDAILVNKFAKVYYCPICGCKMFDAMTRRKRFCLNEEKIDNSIDFYKTESVFGPYSLNIVSKRVYNLIMANQIDRGLVFIPLNPFGEEMR